MYKLLPFSPHLTRDVMCAGKVSDKVGVLHCSLPHGSPMKTTALALIGTLLWTAYCPQISAAWFRGGFTGEEMLNHCRAEEKDPVKDFGRGICIGFIDGFVAGHFSAETYHAFHHREEKIDEIYGHLCIPDTVNRGQLAKVFVQFLEKNPQKAKLPAGLILEDALRDAFPCAGK
jgi:hypothetical protein